MMVILGGGQQRREVVLPELADMLYRDVRLG